MPHDVTMPQMGESIAEGTVTAWLKKPGDRVERDEPLFEISTDKVDAEIPSPVEGTLLEIKVEPGQTVPIHTVVALIGAPGETSAPEPPSAAAAADGPAPAGDVAAPPGEPGAEAASAGPEDARRVKSSPVVRKIAAEHGVRIPDVPGTGVGGRVTKQDILAYIDGGSDGAARSQAPASSPAGAPSPAAETVAPLPTTVPDAYRPHELEGDRVEQMSTMRQKISEHMVISRRVSAHVTTVFDIDFSRAASLRAEHKAVWLERHGVKLTFLSFLMKAAVDALKEYPALNASVDGDRVIYHEQVNLGVAVALDWGLIVPVIHRADELNMLGLARRAMDLAERARGKKLLPDEVQGGTFTITNHGTFGSLFATPIINQPQVAILGVGVVEKRPVVIDDMIGIRSKAHTGLSFDHRLVDGAMADQFMARIKRGIEQFDASHL